MYEAIRSQASGEPIFPGLISGPILSHRSVQRSYLRVAHGKWRCGMGAGKPNAEKGRINCRGHRRLPLLGGPRLLLLIHHPTRPIYAALPKAHLGRPSGALINMCLTLPRARQVSAALGPCQRQSPGASATSNIEVYYGWSDDLKVPWLEALSFMTAKSAGTMISTWMAGVIMPPFDQRGNVLHYTRPDSYRTGRQLRSANRQ